MFKIIALSLLGAAFLWNLFLSILQYRSRNNPIPEELSDVYDHETYNKWKQYSAENIVLDIVKSVVSFVVTFVLIITDVFSLIANNIDNIYSSAIVVVAVSIGVSTVFDVIFGYIGDMKIEEKYGFNKMTMKTFIADKIKGLIISSALLIGALCLFIVLYENMHDYILVLFSGIMFVIMMFITFLYPLFSKIFNKFTSLPEGELRTKLINMLEKYGYQVRDIKVMDASRRTTKSNAYFTGFGKSKTIVLYDNILNAMDEDEIVAVFAHEMGHGLHKDTLKNTFLSLFNIVIIVVFAWLLVRFPEIYGTAATAANRQRLCHHVNCAELDGQARWLIIYLFHLFIKLNLMTMDYRQQTIDILLLSVDCCRLSVVNYFKIFFPFTM